MCLNLLKAIELNVLKLRSCLRYLRCSPKKEHKVTIIGCTNGVCQPLSLLLKNNRRIKELRLYGRGKNVEGIQADLSHINTSVKVSSYVGNNPLAKALKHTDIIVMLTAGKSRKEGMSREDILKENARIMYKVAHAACKVCPNAFYALVTNPINSLVPIMAEILKKCNCYNPKKVFGLTGIDKMRASTFLAEKLHTKAEKVYVPVVGGHDRQTMVPLLSQSRPSCNFSHRVRGKLIDRIKTGGDEIGHAKQHDKQSSSATLSIALATALFINSLLRALDGESVNESAYVECDVTASPFFVIPFKLGKEGIIKFSGFGKITHDEKHAIHKAAEELRDKVEEAKIYILNSYEVARNEKQKKTRKKEAKFNDDSLDS